MHDVSGVVTIMYYLTILKPIILLIIFRNFGAVRIENYGESLVYFINLIEI